MIALLLAAATAVGAAGDDHFVAAAASPDWTVLDLPDVVCAKKQPPPARVTVDGQLMPPPPMEKDPLCRAMCRGTWWGFKLRVLGVERAHRVKVETAFAELRRETYDYDPATKVWSRTKEEIRADARKPWAVHEYKPGVSVVKPRGS